MVLELLSGAAGEEGSVTSSRRKGNDEKARDALEEEDVEAAKVGHGGLDGLDGIGLNLDVERKEEDLAAALRLLRDVVAHVLGVLLLGRQVHDRAAHASRVSCWTARAAGRKERAGRTRWRPRERRGWRSRGRCRCRRP